jgi:hypothetical protein
VRVALSLELPPGKYQLRVAAARTDERAGGSAFEEIDVPDFRGDFTVGALVLGTNGASGLAGVDRIVADLGLVPLATRDLPARMPVRAVMPLQVSSRYRAATVQFVSRLTSPDGQTREIVRIDRPAAAFTKGGAFDFDPRLHELAPGEYQLGLDASIGDRSGHRQISFRILPESR